MVLSEVKEAFVKDLIAKGKRADGRGFLEYREIRVEKNLLPNAEGSALACIGDTKVLAGIKFDLGEPFPDRLDEGLFMVGAEFSPIAHPEFYAGPPDENSIELARVIDRGIRSAKVIDLKKLGAVTGSKEKVFGLFLDLHILDHFGNLIDCASLAAMAALSATRLPKYDADGAGGEKIIREEFVGPLEIGCKVVSCSFEKIDGKTVVDASFEEELASDGRLTLSTASDELVCAAQKSGRAGFTEREVLDLIDVALEKRKELIKFV